MLYTIYNCTGHFELKCNYGADDSDNSRKEMTAKRLLGLEVFSEEEMLYIENGLDEVFFSGARFMQIVPSYCVRACVCMKGDREGCRKPNEPIMMTLV